MRPSGGLRRRNRHTVDTGAGHRTGTAFAPELAARGGRVVCSGIDDAAAQATATAVDTRPGPATQYRRQMRKIRSGDHPAVAHEVRVVALRPG